MELTFDKLRENISNRMQMNDSWEILMNEKTKVIINSLFSNHPLTFHYVPCPEFTAFLKKESGLDLLVYRQTYNRDDVILESWYKAVVFKNDSLYELRIAIKKEEQEWIFKYDAFHIDEDWLNHSDTYTRFDSLRQHMLTWISELPEYRLHMVTGNINMRGWN